MNRPSIYLNSRGFSRDYAWLDADGVAQDPPQYAKIQNILDGESQSIAIFRDQYSYLILLVLNCPSANRKDSQQRIIRDSVLWILPDNQDNEKLFRKIAAKILYDSNALQPIFSEVINFPEPETDRKSRGFSFDSDKLQDKLREINFPSSPTQASGYSLDQSSYRAENSKVFRESLAQDLLSNDPFPKDYEFLVIVTGIQGESDLERFKIWRALSELIKSDEWEKVPDPEGTSSKKYAAIVILIIIIILAIALLLLLLTKRHCNSQNLSIHIQDLPISVSKSCEIVKNFPVLFKN